jgi:2,7-dihydroxy-5-methyl-1-naphthoate 7-O-methyltransferase
LVGEAVDLEALSDLATPWFLRVAVTLHLPELINDGVDDVECLADRTGATTDGVWAVLTHLSERGVFARVEPGRFAMNEPARALLDTGQRRWLDLDGIGGRFAGAWAGLVDLVRTGRPGYERLFGRTFWDDLTEHRHLGESFDALMSAGHGDPDHVPPLAGGWTAVRAVVDVGGGLGHVLANLLAAHPHLRGTLVDLPATAERARATLNAGGVADRVTIVGQSFFERLPPGGDVYLLRSVLNDWPDEEAQRILARCAEAAGPGGRILVAGGIRPDDAPPRIEIDKLVTGGRDRPLREFRAMAEAVGADIAATHVGAVECIVGPHRRDR